MRIILNEDEKTVFASFVDAGIDEIACIVHLMQNGNVSFYDESDFEFEDEDEDTEV